MHILDVERIHFEILAQQSVNMWCRVLLVFIDKRLKKILRTS